VALVGLFAMAHAVPISFNGNALWLAVPYVAVTLLSSVLSLLNPRATGANLEGLARYVPIAVLGGGLLIAGPILESAQQWIWLASLTVNVIAAALGAGAVYAVDAKHFAERHGLILTMGLTFAITLYWAYFEPQNLNLPGLPPAATPQGQSRR
jgi:low temperature requirement protein LtrA